MTATAADPSDTDRSPRRKATLFCPSCDHASPADGDWRLRARGDRTAYVCPTCETTVTERPADEDAPAVDDTPTARVARAWGQLVTSPFRALRVTVESRSADVAEPTDRCT